MSEIRLDLRGMRCPWPALRVARAIREAGQGTAVVAVADDPAAPREIAAVAQERDWECSAEDTGKGTILRLIAKRS